MAEKKYTIYHLLAVIFGCVFLISIIYIPTLGSNDPKDNNELTLHEYLFTKYPTPKSLYDAIERGDESYDNLPKDIVLLLNSTYERDGGLVVAVP